MSGEHTAGMQLPPKVPPLSPQNDHFDSGSINTCSFNRLSGADNDIHQGVNIKPEPATVVPAAFNPVFWLSQGAMSSSDHTGHVQSNELQEMMQQSQQFFNSSGTNQNGSVSQEEIIPEIEMRLRRFGTGLQRGFGSVDRGDLSSMTADIHLGSLDLHSSSNQGCPPPENVSLHMEKACHSPLGSDPFKMCHMEGEKALNTWDHGSSAGCSSSNTTEITNPGSSMFETTLLWGGLGESKADSDADQDNQMVRSAAVNGITQSISNIQSTCSDHSVGFSSGQSDGDTVMKWCSDHELIPTEQPSSITVAAAFLEQVHQQSPEDHEIHQVKSPQLPQVEQSFSNPREAMNWQIHQGGQDMYDPPDGLIAPMSPELQRMAAVLDQM